MQRSAEQDAVEAMERVVQIARRLAKQAPSMSPTLARAIEALNDAERALGASQDEADTKTADHKTKEIQRP